ncbi:MAG: hypothetical protein CL916_07940 [Deltaproteobacteria bacterium]|nr:hypothetical protein [Deltaproteobacteria bacterium]
MTLILIFLTLIFGTTNAYAEELGSIVISVQISEPSSLYAVKNLESYLYEERTCKNKVTMKIKAYGQLKQVMPNPMTEQITECLVAGIDEPGLSTIKLSRMGNKSLMTQKLKSYFEPEYKKYPFDFEDTSKIHFLQGNWFHYTNGDDIVFEMAESEHYTEMMTSMMKKMSRIVKDAFNEEIRNMLKKQNMSPDLIRSDFKFSNISLNPSAYICKGNALKLRCSYEGNLKTEGRFILRRVD